MNIEVIKEIHTMLKDEKRLPNIITPDKEAIIIPYEPKKLENKLVKKFGEAAVKLAFKRLYMSDVLGMKDSDRVSYIKGWDNDRVYYIRLDKLEKLLKQ